MTNQPNLTEHAGDSPSDQTDGPPEGPALPKERRRQEGDHSLQTLQWRRGAQGSG